MNLGAILITKKIDSQIFTISCLNRIFLIIRFYCIFVHVIHNRFVVPPIFRIHNEVSILYTVCCRILSFMEMWLVTT
jgi:hypothetical protein